MFSGRWKIGELGGHARNIIYRVTTRGRCFRVVLIAPAQCIRMMILVTIIWSRGVRVSVFQIHFHPVRTRTENTFGNTDRSPPPSNVCIRKTVFRNSKRAFSKRGVKRFRKNRRLSIFGNLCRFHYTGLYGSTRSISVYKYYSRVFANTFDNLSVFVFTY